MKKSVKKKKAYQRACKEHNRAGRLNDVDGTFRPTSAFRDSSMVRDGLAGSVKR